MTTANRYPVTGRRGLGLAGSFLLASALVLVVLAGWILVTGVVVRQDFNARADVAAATADRLTVVGNNTSITIAPSPDSAIHVLASGRYSTSKPQVSAVNNGGEVLVAARCPDELIGTCTLSAVVSLPAGMPVQVNTDNGQILASQLTGSLDLRTDNGDITAQQTPGTLVLQTDNGDITVNSGSAQVRAGADNGAIEIILTGVPTVVEARANNGNLDIRVPAVGPYLVDARSDSGKTSIAVPQDNASTHRITAITDTGEVVVHSS